MALAAKAVLHSYGSGQRICAEGGPVTDFFIIERGVCIVTKWVRDPGALSAKEIEALNDPVLGAPRPGDGSVDVFQKWLSSKKAPVLTDNDVGAKDDAGLGAQAKKEITKVYHAEIIQAKTLTVF